MGEVCNNAGCFNSGMVSTLKTGLVLQPCRMWFIDLASMERCSMALVTGALVARQLLER